MITAALVFLAFVVIAAMIWLRGSLVLLNQDTRVMLDRQVELRTRLDEFESMIAATRTRLKEIEDELL